MIFTFIQFICLLILFVVIASFFYKDADIFSPGRVFLGVWSFVIFLTEFKFSGFQHTWSLYSWVTLLIGIFSFILGQYIVNVNNLKTKFLDINIIRVKVAKTNQLNENKIYYSIIILFVLYLFSYLAEVMIIGNVPLFSVRIDKARVDFGVFGLHMLVNLQLIIMFLCIEYFVIKKNIIKYRSRLVIIIFFLTTVTFFLLLQRFNFFLWALMIIPLLFYGSKFFTIKKTVIAISLFFAFLYIIESIRFSQYVADFIYVTSKMRFPREYASFSGPYMYIVMNLENFTRAVDKNINYYYGILSFDWLMAITGIKHWVKEYYNLTERPFLISGYNTFPFLWSYYYDFGVVGVAIFPFILGYVTNSIYIKLRTSGHIFWLIMYCIIFSFILISFFTNIFTMLNIIFSFSILLFVHKLSIIKYD